MTGSIHQARISWVLFMILGVTQVAGLGHAAAPQELSKDDVNLVIKEIAVFNKHWPLRPKEYRDAVMRTASRLAAVSAGNSKAQTTLLGLFREVTEKKLPEGKGDQSMCLAIKSDLAIFLQRFDLIRKDKSSLLALAKFSGNMRSLIIPGYVNLSTSRPGLDIVIKAGVFDASELTDPDHKAAYSKAVEVNEERKRMSRLQATLAPADSNVQLHLLHFCSQLTWKDPEHAKFLNEVASAAKLTQAEMDRLQSLSAKIGR